MNLLKDISKNHLQFGDQDIPIYFDDDELFWFGAREVAIALGYSHNQETIKRVVQRHVDSNQRKQFHSFKSDTKLFDHRKLFINEPGLYQLIFSSKMDEAKKFTRWVTKDVILSIRKYGSYRCLQDCQKNSTKILDRLNFLEEENKKLKYDIKRKKYPTKGGYVYAMNYSNKYEEIYRIGMTTNMACRKKIYDTHTLHNHEIAFYIEYDLPKRLEACIRIFLEDYRYSNRKDFFECSLDKIKSTFATCKNDIEKKRKKNGGSKRKQSGGSKTNPSKPKKHIGIIDKKIIQLRKESRKLDRQIIKLKKELYD